MEFLIDEVCGYINNFFEDQENARKGNFTISGKTFQCDYIQNGQYFRVKNSAFNDGVWKYPATDMTDEQFNGEIVPMKIPVALLHIIEDIGEWQNKFEAVDSPNMSPFSSESFNNYSYSKGSRSTSSGSVSGAATTWRDVFGMRLIRWRKL